MAAFAEQMSRLDISKPNGLEDMLSKLVSKKLAHYNPNETIRTSKFKLDTPRRAVGLHRSLTLSSFDICKTLRLFCGPSTILGSV